ncbi:hypothetical protein VSU19_01180 [Verrucomicrobiales bacterium BCK34]|nr:hypothetical protein [Verrucomicrobiales bacterium BCK34]
MNAPFQNVGIIFFVTIVHVVAIAVYSSKSLPATTVQRAIEIPDVESLEVMPEQLVGKLSGLKSDEVIEKPGGTDKAAGGESVGSPEKKELTTERSDDVVTTKVSKQKEDGAVLQDAGGSETVPGKSVSEGVVAAEVFKEIPAERWEESDFAKRVQYPALDGMPGKKAKKLAENKAKPVLKTDLGSSGSEPARRARSFSPIPGS